MPALFVGSFAWVLLLTLSEGRPLAAKGLVIEEYNYLDVYTYDRWGTANLPPFDGAFLAWAVRCAAIAGTSGAYLSRLLY